jgi:ABC-type nitrate/sulfonate/bicarbonate transport system substrate-binding protein
MVPGGTAERCATGVITPQLATESRRFPEVTVSIVRVAWVCAIPLLLAACGGTPRAAAPAAAPSSAAEAPAAAARPAATPAARAPATVEVGVIAVTLSYWAVWAGDAKGFFADEGVHNEVTATRSMTSGLAALSGGSLHLLGGSPTAFIQAVEHGADLVAVASGQRDPAYSLIARPEIHSIDDLRGRTLAISALNGGDTVVLRKMLATRGMGDSDVDYTLTGGTPERYAAIVSGGAVAGLLSQPHDLQARAQGYPQLMFSTEVLQDYQYNSWVVRRDWAAANADVLVRWLRAYAKTSRWLADTANREEAIALGVERTKADPEITRQTYDLLVVQLAGRVIPADPAISMPGLRVTVDDMVASGDLGAPPPPAEKYVDNSYLERAQR